MTAETIEEKALRLLIDERVAIKLAMPGHYVGVVQGDHGIHSVDLTRGSWTCSCAARKDCSHLLAVRKVTTPERKR